MFSSCSSGCRKLGIIRLWRNIFQIYCCISLFTSWLCFMCFLSRQWDVIVCNTDTSLSVQLFSLQNVHVCKHLQLCNWDRIFFSAVGADCKQMHFRAVLSVCKLLYGCQSLFIETKNCWCQHCLFPWQHVTIFNKYVCVAMFLLLLYCQKHLV